MKLSGLVAGAAVAAAAAPEPARFDRVPLSEPLNWTPGPRLFPHLVIREKAQSAPYDRWERDAWAQHILDQCKQTDGCHSTLSFSALSTTGSRARIWVGYLFRGGPTTEYDYWHAHPRRTDGVQDSVAYTIVNQA
ncbi:hypothetical protein CDD83_3223 [Cordyceps sp. RAO-2017]|nr:hypothetical protein CDD83_3223 [Cordyceps sp. RAO-2017]